MSKHLETNGIIDGLFTIKEEASDWARKTRKSQRLRYPQDRHRTTIKWSKNWEKWVVHIYCRGEVT